MAEKNRPSGNTIALHHAEYVFTCMMSDLYERVDLCHGKEAGNTYQVLNISRLLRSLVYDKPLCDVVNRHYGLTIQVPRLVYDNYPGVSRNRRFAPEYKNKYDNPPLGRETAFWFPSPMQEYLQVAVPGLVVDQQTITPAEAIRFYANTLGGVHLDGGIKERDVKSAQVDLGLTIGGFRAVEHTLVTKIAPDVLRALDPLWEAVMSKRTTAAE